MKGDCIKKRLARLLRSPYVRHAPKQGQSDDDGYKDMRILSMPEGTDHRAGHSKLGLRELLNADT